MLGSTGQQKCFQSRFTCQDAANYSPGTLTLRFARGQGGAGRYENAIPSLVSAVTAPAAINLGGMNVSVAALGQRETVNLTFEDHQHSDLQVDKYRLERVSGAAQAGSPAGAGYDPNGRGTFWGKWLARNPYHSGYPLRVYEGYVGDALAAMRVRRYVIDRVDGPTDGKVKVVAKDVFSLVEKAKAVAPRASRGELLADLTGTPATFSLSPAGIGALDYPASGYVNIGSEIIRFTRSGDVMTVVTRGALSTTQDNHQQEDLVQLVLEYQARLAHDIIFDLICTYTALGNAGSPTGSPYITKSEWDTAAATLTALYTGRVATPTPVQDLIGELCEQAALSVWPDVESGMLRLKAFRAANTTATIDDRNYLVDRSLSLKRQFDKRASQVWVYYAQVNPTMDLTERRNFRSRYVTIDANAEGAQQYGTPAIREVFSRWIPQFGRGVALAAAERLLAMFRDPPVEAQFDLHADRAGEVELAGLVNLETSDVQDDTGAVASVQHAVTKIERNDDSLTLTTQSATFPLVPTDKTIFIENSTNNLNLRTLHDSIYVAPVSGSPNENITFVIDPGVVVGSTSMTNAALTVGSWPSGVHLALTINGEIQGKGGDGVSGGSADLTVCPGKGFPLGVYTLTAGVAGTVGGTALDATGFAITITNNGAVRGGGGSAGGGGAAAGGNQTWQPGGGSGAGRGSNPSVGGSPGNRTNSAGCSTSPYPSGSDVLAAPGAGGTSAGAGAGGGGGVDEQSGINTFGGAGGTGGDWGTAGAAGTAGTGGVGTSGGGAGGGAGPCTAGNANITWLVNGTRQGPLN